MKAREARPCDRPAIEALINRACYASPALWRWEAHLGEEGFILVEKETRPEHNRVSRIAGALCASADASPVAWIRLAAVDADLDVRRWLDLSLPPTVRALSARGVRELAWMDSWMSGAEPHEEWALTHLKPRGFSPLAEIITLTKTDQQLPDTPEASAAEPDVSEITLRPATEADLPAIASIDRAAFEPYWWRSEATLGRRVTTACRFTVAECGSEVIGYTEGELHLPTAHLNRIAIHPRSQGRGVGAILLSYVLQALWQRGARMVSLNTQSHNHRSRRLYERFGFKTTGDVVTAWTLRPITPHIPSAGRLDRPK